MANSLLLKLRQLSLEEKILNLGALMAAVGVFFPWIEGRWLAEEARLHTGFGFYTSFLGIVVFALHAYILLVTIVPMTSQHHILPIKRKGPVRFYCSTVATILVLAALSVLMNVTIDFQGLHIRFGVYVSLLGSMAATLYAFLLLQEQHRNNVKQFFSQPQETVPTPEPEPQPTNQWQTPPPPPAEDHSAHAMRRP